MKRSIVQQIAQLPPKQQELFPEIRVEPEIKVEPVFEVTTPPPDMTAFADALKKLMIPSPNIDVHVNKEPKKVKIDVERDNRGFIKSLICTQLANE